MVKRTGLDDLRLPRDLPLLDVTPGGDAVAVSGEVISKVAVDKVWVEQRLVQIVDRCMQAEPVVDRKGTPTGEYTFQAAAAIRALELLGKHIGMFVDRKEIRTGPIEEASDDRLRELLGRYATQTGIGLVAGGGGSPGEDEPTQAV